MKFTPESVALWRLAVMSYAAGHMLLGLAKYLSSAPSLFASSLFLPTRVVWGNCQPHKSKYAFLDRINLPRDILFILIRPKGPPWVCTLGNWVEDRVDAGGGRGNCQPHKSVYAFLDRTNFQGILYLC